MRKPSFVQCTANPATIVLERRDSDQLPLESDFREASSFDLVPRDKPVSMTLQCEATDDTKEPTEYGATNLCLCATEPRRDTPYFHHIPWEIFDLCGEHCAIFATVGFLGWCLHPNCPPGLSKARYGLQ